MDTQATHTEVYNDFYNKFEQHYFKFGTKHLNKFSTPEAKVSDIKSVETQLNTMVSIALNDRLWSSELTQETKRLYAKTYRHTLEQIQATTTKEDLEVYYKLT